MHPLRRCLSHASSQRHAYVASRHLLPEHLVSTSTGWGPYHASLHRQCPRRLRPSPTEAPIWFISREGSLPHLLTLPRRRRFRSIRTCAPSWRTYGEGPLPRLPPSAMTTVPPVESLSSPPGCLTGRVPCHAFLHRSETTSMCLNMMQTASKCPEVFGSCYVLHLMYDH